jgi:hypothetical protein
MRSVVKSAKNYFPEILMKKLDLSARKIVKGKKLT